MTKILYRTCVTAMSDKAECWITERLLHWLILPLFCSHSFPACFWFSSNDSLSFVSLTATPTLLVLWPLCENGLAPAALS